jgi:hypothetical protein
MDGGGYTKLPVKSHFRPGAGTKVRLLWSRAFDDPGLAALDGVIAVLALNTQR